MKTLAFEIKTKSIKDTDVIAVLDGKLDEVKKEGDGRGMKHIRVQLAYLAANGGKATVGDLMKAGQDYVDGPAADEASKKVWAKCKNKVAHVRWLMVAFPGLVAFEGLADRKLELELEEIEKAEAAEKAKLDRQAKKAAKQTEAAVEVTPAAPAPEAAPADEQAALEAEVAQS